ncbi:uncharacterized protein F4812DRAFT_210267 [Daldinia caldariorum]|uniref:uncharacterized protein n=1 Tax=Daldinia caldariorum TaxID=326644 RepID=UPI002008A986|nr:uncharacterized protein F4812DRAFT_210267 [Daldinia caldariorum]KAI1464388.1 hypothetical protein F4812DRAFT_210267 [Daldinia caldariorum]
MCFGSSKDTSNNDSAPKPAAVPPQRLSSSSLPQSASAAKASISNSNGNGNMRQDNYAPPPGPPPSHGQYYTPPPGPPPSHHHQQDYAPPPGPPPPPSSFSSDTKNNPFYNSGPGSDYAPPPGPPPSHNYHHQQQQSSSSSSSQNQQQKQHDWQSAVPDTSLLPPPPNFFSGFDRSPANNATEEQCDAGEAWCAQYPLYPPMPLNPPAEAASRTGNIAVFAPPSFLSSSSNGNGGSLSQLRPGLWSVSSPRRRAPDACLATYPPLYHAAAHSPLVTGTKRKTVYYEVRVLERGSRKDEVSLALGYVAPPYPGFRLPGWHRGSVGVHGDDGHRYVNDRWGGKAFAAPFRRGETIGLGMEFSLGPRRDNNDHHHHNNNNNDNNGMQAQVRVEVFLTRDGAEAGRWDLHEETDREQDLPVTGLEGYHDLCAAVGVFDQVACEIVFAPELWKWKGYRG